MRPALGGRLSVAQDPAAAGGSDTLARSELSVPNGSGYQVTHTTADGVATTYRVELLPSGDEQRTTLNPDGTQALTVIGADGSRSVTQADGTTQHTTLGPDPRFGMQAPLETTASLSTPDGLHATVSASRTTALSNPTDPLSLTTQTDSVAVNGRPPTTSTYTAATRVTTDTTPAGRQTQTTVDAKGRVTKVQAASLHPLRLSYDADGRPTTMKYGPDPDTAATRVNTVTYVDDFAIAFEDYPAAAKGQVKTSTDAAGRTTTSSTTLPRGSAPRCCPAVAGWNSATIRPATSSASPRRGAPSTASATARSTSRPRTPHRSCRRSPTPPRPTPTPPTGSSIWSPAPMTSSSTITTTLPAGSIR